MNKTKKNFWLDVILLALFMVTILSLAGHHSAIGIMVHSVAGALMILGSVMHLVWHWDWIKANILHYPKDIGKACRAYRRADLPLLILFALCGLSGLMLCLLDLLSLPYLTLFREGWSHLHALSGLFMFVLMLLHVGQHWKWLVCMARKCFAPGKPMKLTLNS